VETRCHPKPLCNSRSAALCFGRGNQTVRVIFQASPYHNASAISKRKWKLIHHKRQFYTLSKKHHPDLNPHDKSSSQKFVAISEAYHILGYPEKRLKYDREYAQFNGPPRSSSLFKTGSHSSHSARKEGTGPGGRPASGLSRRRTQFRGPPPSFYQSGGYGAHSAKRETNNQQQSHSHPSSADTNPGGLGSSPPHGPGGFSPGQESPFRDPDPNIPYWNKAAHLQTHDALRQRRERSGAERALGLDEDKVGGSMFVNFILVSSVIALVAGVTGWLHENGNGRSGGSGNGNGRKEARENG